MFWFGNSQYLVIEQTFTQLLILSLFLYIKMKGTAVVWIFCMVWVFSDRRDIVNGILPMIHYILFS